MQVLKESVRQRIVTSARKEFRKKSFEKASMRAIASSAGMTVGNLYRYYKNKEDLFGSIIEPLYKSLQGLKKEIQTVEGDKISWLLTQLKDLQKEYRIEWLILSAGSQGSKYEKALDNVYALLQTTIKEVLTENNKQSSLAAPVASAILHGLRTILQTEKKNSPEVVDEFLQFMMSDMIKRVAS